MNNELILKNKYKVVYMPKTKAKAFENVKNGDVIEITLPLTHKRSGDNNSLIAYYPIINGNKGVGIPTIKKLMERGMILKELESSDVMNLKDYSKYYVQGSDHYLIPKDVFKELFNEMLNWKEESQKKQEMIDKAINFTNENWGSWCSNHFAYMTELQNILNEVK